MKHAYIIIFLFAFMACKNSENNQEALLEVPIASNELVISKPQFEGEKMALGKLETRTFNETIKTSGLIDVPPHNKASISSFVGGYITKTPLLIGDKVKKGQMLITLENPEYVEIQQQYLEVSEQIAYLESEFSRQKTLFDEKITSQKNYLKAESSYKSTLALYNGLRKKLSMLNINPATVEQGNISSTINLYAPIDGYVTKVNASNGLYISPSDIVMEIVDTDHIHLELSVYEKDILHIKKDQKITFKIPEASNETFEAEVHLVGTTIDEATRTVKIHAHILNEKQANFIVGMFVEAQIITDAAENLALPKEAIIEQDGNYFALVLKSKTADTYHFEKVKVDIGTETEAYTSILKAEKLIDKDIIVKGAFMLLSEGGE
jgi:membrane fusion protein, heavy metal efflux system